jgi:hypothetical protein
MLWFCPGNYLFYAVPPLSQPGALEAYMAQFTLCKRLGAGPIATNIRQNPTGDRIMSPNDGVFPGYETWGSSYNGKRLRIPRTLGRIYLFFWQRLKH